MIAWKLKFDIIPTCVDYNLIRKNIFVGNNFEELHFYCRRVAAIMG